jgi:hypothetical protein
MPGLLAKATLFGLALLMVTSAEAQMRRKREPRELERSAPPASVDKRDSIVAAPSAFSGRPYWVALADCGGVYFKLNLLYADAAAHARIKPDAREAAEYTKKLTAAIRIATTYFDATESFLKTDRNFERDEAVLTYDGQSNAAGERVKTIDAALAAAKACPDLYRACQKAYAKECSEPLEPTS